MTGYALLAALQMLDHETLAHDVTLQGCDCDGDLRSVEIRTYEKVIQYRPDRKTEQVTDIYLRRDP